MRFVIFALGTRGDVQPAASLAVALSANGHRTVLAVSTDLVGFAAALGVDARPLSVDVKEFLESPEGQHWLASGDVRQYLKAVVRKRSEVAAAVRTDMIEIAADADVIVSTNFTEGEAVGLAEWKGVPYIGLHYAPVRANSAFPSVFVSRRQLTPPVNRFTHWLFDRAEWRALGADINRLRQQLSLPAAREPTPARIARHGYLELQAYSSALVPELTRWDERRPLTGFLTLTAAQRRQLRAETMSSDLSEWLDAGDPPIYFGFGSMPVQDADPIVRVIAAAARSLGVRAVVSSGRSNFDAITDPGPHVRLVGAVDHGELFPRCLLAVHHGGAGSTAASLSAGLPTLACSVFHDQPFWGRTLERVGAGRTFTFSELTERRLTDVLDRLLKSPARERAAAIGARIRAEDGTGRAVAHIERFISDPDVLPM